MLGWLFSIALFISYSFSGTDHLLIASAIFAVAGSLGNVGLIINQFKNVFVYDEDEA